MGHNDDLITKATELLAKYRTHSIKVEYIPRPGAHPDVRVETSNITRLDILVNERPIGSYDVLRDVTSFEFGEIMGTWNESPLLLEIQGFEGNRLVARWHDRVPNSEAQPT